MVNPNLILFLFCVIIRIETILHHNFVDFLSECVSVWGVCDVCDSTAQWLVVGLLSVTNTITQILVLLHINATIFHLSLILYLIYIA